MRPVMNDARPRAAAWPYQSVNSAPSLAIRSKVGDRMAKRGATEIRTEIGPSCRRHRDDNVGRFRPRGGAGAAEPVRPRRGSASAVGHAPILTLRVSSLVAGQFGSLQLTSFALSAVKRPGLRARSRCAGFSPGRSMYRSRRRMRVAEPLGREDVRVDALRLEIRDDIVGAA